jgi:hypothetical protein
MANEIDIKDTTQTDDTSDKGDTTANGGGGNTGDVIIIPN